MNLPWCSGTGNEFGASASGFKARLSHIIYLESNAVILYKFWRPQPTLP